MTEQWRAVAGWEGAYTVSDLGRVWSEARTVPGSPGRSRKAGGRFLALTPVRGYPTARLCRDGQSVSVSVHRLVAHAFLGPQTLEVEVRHRDGNTMDCRAVNLLYGSHAENMNDAVQHGTHGRTSRKHCPRGHLLTAPNLRASKVAIGRRECLACCRAVNIVYTAARRRNETRDVRVEADAAYRRIIGNVDDSRVLDLPAATS